MNPAVFRASKIRGIVACEFDDHCVRDRGRAFATMLSGAGKPTIAVGRDGRRSFGRLFAAIVEGLSVSRIKVVELGASSPPLYLAVHHWDMDRGLAA